MSLSVMSHGFDTLAPVFEFKESLPVYDPSFEKHMLSMGWRSQSAKEKPKDALPELGFVPSESLTYWYQSPTNSTLRYWLYMGGSRCRAEFSVPRLLNDSPLNIGLSGFTNAFDAIDISTNSLISLLPEKVDITPLKLSKVDYAIDIVCGDMRPAVIASSANFRFKNARKLNRQIFPSIGSKVWTSQHTFRAYDKSLETLAKLPTVLKTEFKDTVLSMKNDGVIRLELSDQNKKGLPFDYVPRANNIIADRLEQGYSGTKVYIGGLSRIRQKLWEMDLSSQRRTSMYAFAALYAELGHDAIRDIMPRPTFYRKRKQFLELGLSLTDVTKCEGELDFQPVFDILRAS